MMVWYWLNFMKNSIFNDDELEEMFSRNPADAVIYLQAQLLVQRDIIIRLGKEIETNNGKLINQKNAYIKLLNVKNRELSRLKNGKNNPKVRQNKSTV